MYVYTYIPKICVGSSGGGGGGAPTKVPEYISLGLTGSGGQGGQQGNSGTSASRYGAGGGSPVPGFGRPGGNGNQGYVVLVY